MHGKEPKVDATGSSVQTASIYSVQIGRIAPLGPNHVPSGFVKRSVTEAVTVGPEGIAGDEQADLRVHGGPDKAVYGYAWSHYAAWLRTFPEHAPLLVPGGFGENLTIAGLSETTVCFGDIVRVGSCVLQVTQPRQPCCKFALRFGGETVPRAMIRNGYCGWYYRVLSSGSLRAGDALELTDRPCPLWSIERLNRQVVQRQGSAEERAEFAAVRAAVLL